MSPPPRRPRPAAAALAAAAAAALVHVFAGDAAEDLRLEALRVAAAPAALVRRSLDPPPPRPTTLDPEVARRRESERARFLDRDAAALPVVDHRPRDGRLVVGAGRDAGVVFGAPVFAAEGLLGRIERVEAHLSRAVAAEAPGARTAVAATETRPGLPGGLDRLVAVFEGAGDGGVLVDGPLLDALRVGDRLAAFGKGGAPFGVVTAEGPRPRVRTFARAAGSASVSVAGVGARAPVPELFEDQPLAVVLEPAVGGRGALLAGPVAARLVPGAALHAGGVYLGRVERATSTTATASRRDDPGHAVGARLAGPAGEIGVTLVAEGGGVFKVADAAWTAEDGAEYLAFTAGGGGLAPTGLLLARLRVEGGKLRDPAGAPRWPDVVDAAIFVFDEERRRLTGGRR